MTRLFITVSLLLILFQNCGKEVSFSQHSLSEATPEELNSLLAQGDEQSDIAIINDKCNGIDQIEVSRTLNFPKPNQTCQWGEDGNLETRDGYFQARIHQEEFLNLPAGAVICEASFDFEEQDFLYDDHFMLLFNSSVIAASYDFEKQFTAGNFGLLDYHWEQMAGMKWNSSKETIYCPQIPGMQANCSFPGHDQQGLINLHYSEQYIRAIMSNGIPQNHSFSLVSIGDNDQKDCEHSDVTFTVKFKYSY